MKRSIKVNGIIGVILTCVLLLTACGPSSPTWQEQYDLGVRYLSKGNYEEAIIAFTAAIEIDPKQAPAYVGRGDAYVGVAEALTNSIEGSENESEEAYNNAEQDYLTAIDLDSSLAEVYEKLAEIYIAQGDSEKALDILQKGYEATGDETLQERYQALRKNRLKSALAPIIRDLEIPFTVDNVTLGVTDIGTAIAAYSGYPYAMSNPMTEEGEDYTADTIYTLYGYDGTPIPDGYEVDEFGFLFAGPIGGGPVYEIWIRDPGFTCLGILHTGEDANTALTLFGLDAFSSRLDGELTCTTENGRSLIFEGDMHDFSLGYQEGANYAQIRAENGLIHDILLEIEKGG